MACRQFCRGPQAYGRHGSAAQRRRALDVGARRLGPPSKSKRPASHSRVGSKGTERQRPAGGYWGGRGTLGRQGDIEGRQGDIADSRRDLHRADRGTLLILDAICTGWAILVRLNGKRPASRSSAPARRPVSARQARRPASPRARIGRSPAGTGTRRGRGPIPVVGVGHGPPATASGPGRAQCRRSDGTRGGMTESGPGAGIVPPIAARRAGRPADVAVVRRWRAGRKPLAEAKGASWAARPTCSTNFADRVRTFQGPGA